MSINFNCTNSNDTHFLELLKNETNFYYLRIEPSNTTESEVGTYDFEIELKDPLDSTIYTFRLVIATPEKINIQAELADLVEGTEE